MIHVCQIDIGCRYVFDMAQGIDDVHTLKQAIEKQANVALNEQILLISGGEVLKNQKQKLFGLSAGIEESPIYLIDIKNVKLYAQKLQLVQQQQQQHLSSFQDMSKEIDDGINLLEPSYQTILQRSQLATKIYDNDFNLTKQCEQYYWDQYWQYQGFMALIANLDDLITSIEKVFERTREQFFSYNENKTNNLKHLNEIETYIKLLSNIHLLPELHEHATKNLTLFQSICSQSASQQSVVLATEPPLTSSPSSTVSSSSYNNLASPNSTQLDMASSPQQQQTTLSLLEWTNLTDPRHKLETVLLKAKESFEYLDVGWWQQIDNEIKMLINEGNNKQMKEIEGLTKRLSDLNSLIETCKLCLTREKEITESFKTNLNRVATLKDESILHDLCIGHEGSLSLLAENHTKIVDITKRICKAKFELTKVINSRLNWVMNIQTQLVSSLNTKLIVCNEKIRQSNLYMKQVEQIKNAPSVYFQALHETIRREKFSSLYKEFSNEIYSIVSDLTKSEQKRREQFSQKFSRNYIANLFPYLTDSLQSFIKADLNLNFDLNIPKLNEANISLVESEFKQKNAEVYTEQERLHVIYEEDEQGNDLKLLEILNTRLRNEIIKFRIAGQQQAGEHDGGGESGEENTSENKEAMLPADTSTLFLSKLTDTQIANSDNDEQLILVNKKPAANKEFLEKLNEIYKREIADLRGNLEILRENYEQLEKQIHGEYKMFENLVSSLRVHVSSERLKKKQFYKNLLENLFSNTNKTTENETAAAAEEIDDDEEFTKSLKDNLLKLRETYDKSMEEARKSMDSLKMNFLADKQKVFNEAIERVSSDKDRQIDELKTQQEKLNAEIKQLKAAPKAAVAVPVATDSDKEDALQRSLMKQQRLLERVQFLEQQLSKYMHSSSSAVAAGGKSGSSTLATSVSANAVTQQPLSLLQTVASSTTQMSELPPILLPKYQPLSNIIQLNSCAVGDLVIIIYDFTHSSYRIIYQQSPYVHFVHTDSIKIFDTSSQIYKEFINSNEQQQLDSLNYHQQQQSSSSPLATSPASPPSNLDETFANYNFTKEAIQNLIGTNIYNNSSNLLSSCVVQPKESNTAAAAAALFTTSTSTLTPTLSTSMFLNTSSITTAAVAAAAASNLNKPLWFIGRVVNKEFCIARKENNRYKVPSGTQFYRVRIYPYKV